MEGVEMTMNVQAPVEGMVPQVPVTNPIEAGFNLDALTLEAEKYQTEALADVRSELELLQNNDADLEGNVPDTADDLSQVKPSDELKDGKNKNIAEEEPENDVVVNSTDETKASETETEEKPEDSKEGKELLGENNFSGEVAKFHEAIQNGSISPEMALAIILAYLESKTARQGEEETSLLELALMALTRFMLNIIPGGEEAVKDMDKKGQQGKRSGITELSKFLEKRDKTRRSLIENLAA